MTPQTVGLFIGRFQPFHLGHLKVIKNMFGKVDKVIIGIGSSQKSRTKENPFTFNERYIMIDTTIMENIPSFFKYQIVGIHDIESDEEWIDYVCTLIGKIDVVYTGNPHIKSLFKKQGIKIKDTEIIEGLRISGTDIRKRIKEGKKWKHLVPDQVYKRIK